MKVLGLLLGLAASPGIAATCAPYERIAERLTTKFDEHVVSQGLGEAQGITIIVEVWVSTDQSTWTIITIYPNGQSCFVASGHSWLSVNHIPGVDG